MAVDRADLSGDVEARDRFFHRVEDALPDIMLRAALGVVDDGPGFHDIKRRRGDGHHGFGRPFVVAVLASVAERVPALDSAFQHFGIYIDLACDLLDTVTFFNPPFIDLGGIVFAPARLVALVVDDGNADGAEVWSRSVA